MAKKTKMPMNENFESNLSRSGFTKICNDMFESEAWKSLSLRQIGLYLTLKHRYKKNPRTLEDNRNEIVFTTTEALKVYGDSRTFRDDLDVLIDRGFIKQTFSGVPFMKANKYGFSDKWKLYGTDNFSIPDSDKRYKRKSKKEEIKE